MKKIAMVGKSFKDPKTGFRKWEFRFPTRVILRRLLKIVRP